MGILSELFGRCINIFHACVTAVTEPEDVLFLKKKYTVHMDYSINYWRIEFSMSDGFSCNSFG